MQKVANTIEFLFSNGISGFLRECYYRISDRRWESHFGVSTGGQVLKHELGIDHEESIEYSSIAYRHIVKVLDNLPVDKSRSTLLDYGCGKGRVMVVAASLPFKRVIGVELSELVTIARQNTSRMKHRKAQEISLFQGDAREYAVPADVNVIYFYNPFRGSILQKVLENIRESYEQNPRKIHVIFFNDDDFTGQVSTQDWLVKTAQSEVYDEISLGLYETVP